MLRFIANIFIICLNICQVVIARKLYILTFQINVYIILLNDSHGSKHHINYLAIKILWKHLDQPFCNRQNCNTTA